MRFQVKAVRDTGVVERLECDALDFGEASRQVAGLGYTVLKVTPQASWHSWRLTPRFPLLLFSQELSVLLLAGVPLVEAIETLGQKESNDAARRMLAGVVTSLREGLPLSQALQQAPAVFPSLYVASIRAAERTGDIPGTLARFVDYQSRLDAVKKKVVNASIYPALLVAVGSLVSLFLMVYVVPRFSQIYEDRATQLPLLSRMLIHWGNFAEQHGPIIVAALCAAVIAAIVAIRSGFLTSRLEALLWQWPAVAERMRIYQLARFYRSAGMLVRGGIPLVQAFDMAGGVLHARLRESLAHATRSIRQGLPVAPALERNGLATAVASRMLEVGERSGNMGEMMERAAAFHEEELSRWIEWFSRLFEPVLMTLIGLVIGVIVILMYMPIFELAGSIR